MIHELKLLVFTSLSSLQSFEYLSWLGVGLQRWLLNGDWAWALSRLPAGLGTGIRRDPHSSRGTDRGGAVAVDRDLLRPIRRSLLQPLEEESVEDMDIHLAVLREVRQVIIDYL